MAEVLETRQGELLMLQGIYPFQLPAEPEDKTTILNYGKDIEDQYWTRPGIPVDWQSMTEEEKGEWVDLELQRCFETGVWIYIKGKAYWIPPAYYFTLQWWWSKDGYFKFRYNQLLEEYFELFCEGDRWCIATFRFKKRRDGLTTRRMARLIWKAIQTKDGWFGIQSKTGKDAKNVCWAILMRGFRKLPKFFLPELSGTTDPKTMLEFRKPAMRITKSNLDELFKNDIFREQDDDPNTTIDWRDTTSDAYDGQQLDEVTLDEFAKWGKASAIDALFTYMQSCSLDGVKVGMIHCISSPAEKDGRSHKDSIEVWESADYRKIKDEPAFKVYRWFTSALDSYAEAMDKYGFCDREKARTMIMAARKAAPQSKKKEIIRQTPMYIDEIMDAVDNNVFMTSAEINKRRKWLESIFYKDKAETDPKYIYGNFDWANGIPDTEVIFKPSENQEDFSWTGRFAMAWAPTRGTSSTVLIRKMVKGKIKVLAPPNAESVLGVDPYDFKRTAKSTKPSNGSSVMGKCFDFYNQGDLNRLQLIYDFRPKDPNVFYEDQLKAAVYYGAMVNTEARNPKIIDYFEARGYFDWLLPKDMSPKGDKNLKGSATTSNMIEEICTLIESFTSNSLNEIWWEFLCKDLTDFEPEHTQSYNKTMAFGHMLLGFAKRRRFHRMRTPAAASAATDQASAIADAYF